MRWVNESGRGVSVRFSGREWKSGLLDVNLDPVEEDVLAELGLVGEVDDHRG
jgi:hypothetical protein